MIDLRKERILITGGAGFLGTHLQHAMTKRGVPQNNLFTPRRTHYDLLYRPEVTQMYRNIQPTIVIHLAAEIGGIGANLKNPGKFFYTNMQMGLNMIEEARIHEVKKFIQIGTACSYPKFIPVPFDEANLWCGYPEETNAPYGIAKKALLTMLLAYRQQYELNGIYLIPANLYGPGDDFDLDTSHVIAAMIRKFSSNLNSVTLWGSGTVSREFLYVEDAAEGIILAIEQYDSPQPVNLGSGHEITIANLAGMIKLLTGSKATIIWDRSKPDGQPRRCLDITLAKYLFNFEAATSLEDGLKKTIKWYKKRKISA